MILCAAHADVIGLFETPRRSKMAWLSEWNYLLDLPNVQEQVTASCMFGSPFQKEFRFLTCNMEASSIRRKCDRSHFHIRIEGSITKGAAVYTVGELGRIFSEHLEFQQKLSMDLDVHSPGLEEPLSCEISRCAQWTVGSSWKWKGKSHINVLERASYFQAFKDAARRGGGRFSFLVDSSVTLFSTSKGRSSSRALAPLVRKIMAIAIAFGVFGSNHFTPTRLNVSDDPTRDQELRAPARKPVYDGFHDHAVYALAQLPKLRRWISNWVSLLFGLYASQAFVFPGFSADAWRSRQACLPISLHQALMEFDSALGFPGEGPFAWTSSVDCLVSCLWVSSPPLVSFAQALASAMKKMLQELREEEETFLEYGRPVQQVAKDNRARRIAEFRSWLETKGIQFDELLSAADGDPENLCRALSEYGRLMFHPARPYSLLQ